MFLGGEVLRFIRSLRQIFLGDDGSDGDFILGI